jgi:hypothetical protein
MSRRARGLIALDTLGKLRDRGHALLGYCRTCGRAFRVSMDKLIREHGAASPIVGMPPPTCPSCGDKHTIFHVTAPSKGRA